ncbi:hypothetical protein [Streptomyces flaveolus]|uniref:hypothetical protein n=1 Tax=Streptomyces flaveolus TaxID=67297 RepID=UPI0037FCF4FE
MRRTVQLAVSKASLETAHCLFTRSKVELYAAIRRDHRDGLSMRELERKHAVTWRIVRKALDSSWPQPRKKLPPRSTGLDQFKPVIDEILRADLDAPRKQRHTVTRIFHRLVEKHGADCRRTVGRPTFSRGAAEPGDSLLQVVEGTLFLLRSAMGSLEHAVAASADPGVSIEAGEDLIHQLLLRMMGRGGLIVLP